MKQKRRRGGCQQLNWISGVSSEILRKDQRQMIGRAQTGFGDILSLAMKCPDQGRKMLSNAVEGSGLRQHGWTMGGGGEAGCVKGRMKMGSGGRTRRSGLEVGRDQENILRGI